MRFLKTLIVAIGLCVPIAAIAPAFSQDKPAGGLTGVLDELLRGTTDDAQNRRIPFTRNEIQLSFAPLVQKTAPAVVNVYASQQVSSTSPFAGDPFFEQFFGRAMPRRSQSSLGSGVLVDPSGIVVTNDHVVKNADQVKVATADGREYPVKILLKDESVDLAVLKIEGADPFPTIDFGDSDALEVGDLVLAIGNPFGVGQTTTSGIVSALARSHLGISDLGFFIQTDAAINPGNSGGALIDMQGHLVGINSAIFSRSGGSIGIGFAIPANIVHAVVESAKAGHDYFERPYIGADFADVTGPIAEALGLDRPTGALVSAVDPDSPAAKAGIVPGDVVLSVDKTAVDSVGALNYRLATRPIGETAELEILSQGGRKTLEVSLEPPPAGEGAARQEIAGNSPFAGLKVATLSPQLAQRLGMRGNPKAVVVVDIAGNSPAARVGFRPKDILREVNGVTIDTPEQLKEAAAAETRWWRFTVERDGQVIHQTLRY